MKDRGVKVLLTGISSIDWDKIWEEQMNKASFTGDGVGFWNQKAHLMNTNRSFQNNYTRGLLSRMNLSPEMTVLDVGCGTGAMTIPMAERVHSVTALDFSPTMLQYLEKSISDHSLTNVQTKNSDFLAADLAELGNYDVVLASCALPMGNLRQALTRMDSASRNLCYLTWIARPREIDTVVCEAIGEKYHPYPDYPIIANMLYTMGIHANLEIFSVTNEQSYSSLDDAINNSLRGQKIDDNKRNYLRDFFKAHSVYEDGYWTRSFTDYWALIWWQKEKETG